MNRQEQEFLHKYVMEAADKIDVKLHDYPLHPHAKIPSAFCYGVINEIMGKWYWQCSSNRLRDMMQIVDLCVEHAGEDQIIERIRHGFEPEPREEDPATLDEFLADDRPRL